MNIVDGKKDEILFHIGLHKTASSSLQKDFFVPENGFINLNRNKLLHYFIDKFSTELLSPTESNDLKAFVKQSFNNNLYPVASHERLSGYPLFGGYDRLSILNRISKTNLNVKILYVIREQNTWLYSSWKQLIVDGSNISLDRYINSPPAHPDVVVPSIFRLEYLNYSREIKELYKLFGAENVCVVPLELIGADFNGFIERLKKILNSDQIKISKDSLELSNKSQKLSSIYLQKFLNTYLFINSSSHFGLLDERYDLVRSIRGRIINFLNVIPELPWSHRAALAHKNKIDSVIEDYYSLSNVETSDLIGIDLSNYGYNTEDSNRSKR
jgi:hypothetical protein